MEKKKICKFNKKKGESETKKLGKKKDVEEPALKRCKSFCIEKAGKACSYNTKTRECTVFTSGFKGVSEHAEISKIINSVRNCPHLNMHYISPIVR